MLSGGRTWAFQHVSIGNPQCAIHVDSEDELAALDLPSIGPAIEGSELFPNRTNVSWFTELPGAPERIRARIFERGVGETLSSGTGACGAAVAHLLRGAGSGELSVILDGGELSVRVTDDLAINLTGWARPVFEGRISDEFNKGAQ